MSCIPDDDLPRIYREYCSGKAMSAIGAGYGITGSGVRRCLLSRGYDTDVNRYVQHAPVETHPRRERVPLLPVVDNGFIRPPTKAQLMAGRASWGEPVIKGR